MSESSHLETARLRLVPLRIEDATAMVGVLSDRKLYRFMGGGPPSLVALVDRYSRQVVGHSPDRSQQWLNWIVRSRETETPVGFVQATVHIKRNEAELSWVVGVPWQGLGYASEAALAVLTILQEHSAENAAEYSIERFVARIKRGNRASEAVAAKIGLLPTESVVDREVVWALPWPTPA